MNKLYFSAFLDTIIGDHTVNYPTASTADISENHN